VKVLNHIGVSGGKDSTALALWARYESGYDPASLVLSFCDTENESQIVYDYVQMLSEKVHPVTILKPERDFWELARHKGRFPSAKARFCTEELKMKPTKLFVNALRLLNVEPLMHSGVRASESDDRAKLPEREMSLYFGAEVYRPLLRWSIEDVWAIHKRYNIPPNPLYAMGCKRVGCLPCVMSRKKEIANIAIRWPERIDAIRDMESSINPGGYASMFHRNTVPYRFRSKEIVTSEKRIEERPNPEGQTFIPLEDVRQTTRPGQQMRVATINDVARWAMNDASIYEEEFDFFEESPACDSRYGACE